MFNAFSLRFVPFSAGTPAARGRGENYRGAAAATLEADLQPPLFFRRGKLSLPTGREATNRAPRPR